jgi:hypothetical protein
VHPGVVLIPSLKIFSLLLSTRREAKIFSVAPFLQLMSFSLCSAPLRRPPKAPGASAAPLTIELCRAGRLEQPPTEPLLSLRSTHPAATPATHHPCFAGAMHRDRSSLWSWSTPSAACSTRAPPSQSSSESTPHVLVGPLPSFPSPRTGAASSLKLAVALARYAAAKRRSQAKQFS